MCYFIITFQFYDNIIGAEVFLKIDKAKTNGNKVVDIRLNIPGKDVFAAKQADSFEKAGDEAVEALRKQIINQFYYLRVLHK